MRTTASAPNLPRGTDRACIFAAPGSAVWTFAVLEHGNGGRACAQAQESFSASKRVARESGRSYDSFERHRIRKAALRMDRGSQHLSDHSLNQRDNHGIRLRIRPVNPNSPDHLARPECQTLGLCRAILQDLGAGISFEEPIASGQAIPGPGMAAPRLGREL